MVARRVETLQCKVFKDYRAKQQVWKAIKIHIEKAVMRWLPCYAFYKLSALGKWGLVLQNYRITKVGKYDCTRPNYNFLETKRIVVKNYKLKQQHHTAVLPRLTTQ